MFNFKYTKKQLTSVTNCKVCGTEFVQKKSDHEICSYDCKMDWIKKNRKDNRVESECAQCAKVFLSKSSKHRFCSRDCANEANKDQAFLRRSCCSEMGEYREMQLNNKAFEIWRKAHENDAKKVQGGNGSA